MSSRPIRVALIGYGYAGRTFHAPLISAVSGLALSMVVTSQPAASLPHFANVVAEPALAFGDPTIDLIVVATPNGTHFSLAHDTLLAGKHVVVDKPLTTSVAEAETLVQLATARGRTLSVFHNRRWDADFLTVRQLLSERRLGDVVHFESHYDRYRPEVRQRWREQPGPATGIWWDLGPHLVDQALLLFGSPAGVFADLACQRPGSATPDYFHVLLRYPGVRVILHGGSLVHNETARFQIHGTAASYCKYGLDTQEEALKQQVAPGGPDWGVDPRDGFLTTYTPTFFPTTPGNYLAFYEQLRDCLLDGTANPVPPGEALEVMKVLEAAVQSATSRREWQA